MGITGHGHGPGGGHAESPARPATVSVTGTPTWVEGRPALRRKVLVLEGPADTLPPGRTPRQRGPPSPHSADAPSAPRTAPGT